MARRRAVSQRRDPVKAAVQLHDRAVDARSRGRTDAAEALCLRAIRTLGKAVGLDHPDVANVLLCLGGTFEDRSAYAEAETQYRRAVAILDEATDVPDVQRLQVQALGHLGGACRAQGRYDEAEPLLRRALEQAEKAFGPGDLAVSEALNGLAVLYKYTGRFREAGRLYRRALSIVTRSGPHIRRSLPVSTTTPSCWGRRVEPRRPGRSRPARTESESVLSLTGPRSHARLGPPADRSAARAGTIRHR